MTHLARTAFFTAALLFSIGAQATESTIAVSASAPERAELREAGKDAMPDSVTLTYDPARGLISKTISTQIHTNIPGGVFNIQIQEEPVLSTASGEKIALHVTWGGMSLSPTSGGNWNAALFPDGRNTPLGNDGLAISQVHKLEIRAKSVSDVPVAGTYRGNLVIILRSRA